MCVAGHGYGGAGVELVDDMHAGQRRGLVVCQRMPDHFLSAR